MGALSLRREQRSHKGFFSSTAMVLGNIHQDTGGKTAAVLFLSEFITSVLFYCLFSLLLLLNFFTQVASLLLPT